MFNFCRPTTQQFRYHQHFVFAKEVYIEERRNGSCRV